jgi:hypothetical protein
VSQERDVARAQTGLLIVASILFVILVVLHVVDLLWPEYLRWALVTVCLLAATRWMNLGRNGLVLATVVVVLAAQVCAGATQQETRCQVLWVAMSGVVVAGCVVGGAYRGWWPSILEWVVLVGTTAVWGLSVLVGHLHGLPASVSGGLQWPLLAVLWVLLRRWLEFTTFPCTSLFRAVLLAVVVVTATGCVRIGSALVQLWQAERAAAEMEYVSARQGFARAGDKIAALGLVSFERRSRIGLARSAYALGDLPAVLDALGMTEGWKRNIERTEWQGPTGAELFKTVSCWKDLLLPAGSLEVRVHARGHGAMDEGPRMRVSLGGQVLGELDVNSYTEQIYSFSAEVGTGAHRLEISFLNDYWEFGVADRWISLGAVEIEYTEIAW